MTHLNHAVQFYEHEESLYELVGDFLAEGLAGNEPAIVISTPAHFNGFTSCLREKGLTEHRPLVYVDARTALTMFMRGADVDGERFRSTIGSVIERTGADHESIRAYGEMVDLLWRDGFPDAAIRLEELWNDLANEYKFSLLCAYPIANFYKQSDREHFDKICREHDMIIPGNKLTPKDIVRLQQRALALETEIALRMEIEKALRDTLDENKRLYQLAQDASRAKDRFLATLSHELRTPLTAILGWSRMLTLGGFDEESTRTALETIERSAKTQASLIDDLLDLSRIVTGKLSLESDPVDLNTVAANVIQTVKLAADVKQIALNVSATNLRIVVNGDATRLQQIIWNLLSNAIKFSDAGAAVDLAIERSSNEARVTVRDQGRGIAPDFLPLVFDPFRQADGANTRSHGGLGLGLAIVKYLVESHGGSVTAESEGVGRGSTFTVRLPLAEQQFTHREAPRRESVDLRQSTVLVVDDDDDTRSLTCAVLRRCGAIVFGADSASAARSAFASNQFDIVVTDISMPEEDGFDLLDAVRTADRITPVVALTATADSETEDRVRAAGFAAYVKKPVDPLQFAQVIAELRAK